MRAVFLAAVLVAPFSWCQNFSRDNQPARKFGVHEITLTGDGRASNPFDTAVAVQFTPPSGRAVTVAAFYDGGNTWRARVYISETGEWSWSTACASDKLLDGKSGKFSAADSSLRGMLRKHKDNPRAWMTDDGRTFVNISDTAYRLFHAKEAPLWKEFIEDDAKLGINCIRAASLGGWGGTPGAAKDDNNNWTWNNPWAGGAKPDYARFDLEKFATTDDRLIWMLENHPQMYVQLILFSFRGYGSDGTGEYWANLAPEAREKTMRYMIARWSAFPTLFWLIVNDMHSSEKFPKNQAFAREVGSFFAANDPWHHLMSTGPNRRAGFAFTGEADLKWVSYIHIEDAYALGADPIWKLEFDKLPLHVWLGEDYYEQDHGHYDDPRYFFRWLYWSWLISGGSANYCGRWGPIHPYSQTGRRDLVWEGIDKKTIYTGEQLVGLDSVVHIPKYLEDRKIDVALFTPNDARVADADGRTGKPRPKLMERKNEEFIIYHPNAAGEGQKAIVDKQKIARLTVNLKDAPGAFAVEWFRAIDGVALGGGTIEGKEQRELTAPWKGEDVVVRLTRVVN